MNIMHKLLGGSAVVGMVVFAVLQLSAARTPDEGTNFTQSDSPKTTVFNLKTPSVNRHVHDTKATGRPKSESGQPKSSGEQANPRSRTPSRGDCRTGTVTDYVDKYLVRLEKEAPATVALNTPFDYNYTVKAKDKVKVVVVEEQIPQGTSYVSSSPNAEVSGGTATWRLYNLKKGERVPLRLTVKATSATDLSNCATIVAYPEACTTTTVGVPELAITKTTPEEQVMLNSRVPWNITVTNTGDFCAYDVVVTDTLPSGVSHRSGNSRIVTEIGTLAPGESREITVDTTATGVGDHCNVARVDSSNAGSAQDDACVSIARAGLDVTKEGTPMQFVNKRASYVITATNTGDVPLNDVVVTDTVPTANQLLRAPGANVNGNTATWRTNLAPGQSRSFDLVVQGTREGTYCNQVSVNSSDYGLSASDEACTEWRGYPALLIEVIDTEDPLLVGEETTYVIQITNQGTAPDRNVTLDVALPGNLEVVSANGATARRISGKNVRFAPYNVLQPKEIIEYRVVARATAEGDSRLRAQMSSDLLRNPVPEEESTQVY